MNAADNGIIAANIFIINFTAEIVWH